MNDWIGLLFFALVGAGAFAGLKILAKPARRTAEEFERGAAEGTTTLGASMNALHELLNPEQARGKAVQMEIAAGRYRKKKREGKANADADAAAEAP